MNGTYIAIDLKSFYASVECVDRGLDPLKTNLVVADEGRSSKTICLAVTPSLKAYGIPGRPRLFEVVQRVDEINLERKRRSPGGMLGVKSCNSDELSAHPSYKLDYITAPPRMSRYMEVSSRIYQIYLKYVAPEDIHAYSVDEVFIDATSYLKAYRLSAREFAMLLVNDVFVSTGITATAGIGTNLYLCKVAMDIVAKHIPADKNGVRIAKLNEISYRRMLWDHRPLTDFWRIGGGYSKKLAQYGMFTMGDVVRCSIDNERLLYDLFGVNAELLIDHAWGYEPCTIADIKSYVPENHSLSTGQVLSEPYSFEKGRLIVREMADMLALDLVDKGLVSDQIVLTVGYDVENLMNAEKRAEYSGKITVDHFGRLLPKHAHGSIDLGRRTSSARMIVKAVTELYDRIVNERFTVRRMYVVANHVVHVCGDEQALQAQPVQLDLFTDYEGIEREERSLERETQMQKALLKIKSRYGKNAILKGMNFEEGATAISRNGQVGGHRA
ncbi:MAG: DNA methylase [Oscillospiraceae bacterium]|nr:DNA methylase [Oscillospiraceae bacterium]